MFSQFHGFGRLKVLYVDSRCLIPYPGVGGGGGGGGAGGGNGGVKEMKETNREKSQEKQSIKKEDKIL